MRFKASIKEILKEKYPGCETVGDALAYTIARIKNNEPLPKTDEISNLTLWNEYRAKHGASLAPTTPEPQKPVKSNPERRQFTSLSYKDDDIEDRPDIPF